MALGGSRTTAVQQQHSSQGSAPCGLRTDTVNQPGAAVQHHRCCCSTVETTRALTDGVCGADWQLHVGGQQQPYHGACLSGQHACRCQCSTRCKTHLRLTRYAQGGCTALDAWYVMLKCVCTLLVAVAAVTHGQRGNCTAAGQASCSTG